MESGRDSSLLPPDQSNTKPKTFEIKTGKPPSFDENIESDGKEEMIKPFERLVPVGCMRYRTSTSGLSTWWSSTTLMGELVFGWASRLDAFSGYPVRI